MSKIKTCVSLYSLQDEYLNGRMSLGDIMHFVKDLGVEGIEILPDQMLKGAPELSEETLAEWKRLIAETGLKPVAADVFLNTNLYKNRTLTHRESIDLLIQEIKQAAQLGIHLIRLVSMIPYWVIRPLLPYCEQYDVTIALEVHAAMAFDIPETMAFIEEMKAVNSPYVGLVVDTGIFCRRFPRVVRDYETSVGTSPEIFDYIDSLFAEGKDLHQVLREYQKEHPGQYPDGLLAAMKTPHDQMSVPLCDGYENLPFSVMDDCLPYIKHIHFKLFEMAADGIESEDGGMSEYSIDYKKLLEYLQEHHYDGYVATDYEGNRFTLSGKPTVEKEQVTAHQAYIQKCLKEIQGV